MAQYIIQKVLSTEMLLIDSQTGEEVKPSLYRDDNGEVRGRCKIMPNRPYIVLEVSMEDEDIRKLKLDEEADEMI